MWCMVTKNIGHHPETGAMKTGWPPMFFYHHPHVMDSGEKPSVNHPNPETDTETDAD